MESTDKTYVENIKQIHLSSSILPVEGISPTSASNTNKLVLSVIVKDSSKDKECIFKIMEKERIWIKTFNQEEFTEYKSKMGFDGSWKAFFKTLSQAINKTEGGSVVVKYPKSTKDNLILTVFHPLSEELKVKSDIYFEKVFKAGSEEFKNLNFDMMYELFECKEMYKNKESETNLNQNILLLNGSSNLSNNSHSPGNSSKFEFKKNAKRKYNSNLINPNAKKRKEKGVTFIQEEDEEENGADKSEEEIEGEVRDPRNKLNNLRNKK